VKRVAVGLTSLLVSAIALPAMAQPYPPRTSGRDVVLGETLGRTLANTGANISVWALVALALLAAGGLVVYLGRSRSHADSGRHRS